MAVKYVFNPFTGNLDSVNADGFSKTIECICANTDVVGDCVRIDDDKAGGYFQVEAVDIDVDNDPAIGIIISKSAATFCTVQIFGIVADVYGSLTPGKTYMVGTDSQLTQSVPKPTSGFRWVQQMGTALSSTELFLNPTGFRGKLVG